VAALCVTACSGSIDGADSPASDQPGAPGTPRTPGGPGGAVRDDQATSGTGGSAGTAPLRTLAPGHVTLRRLNRSEYCNTVRDLLGTSLRPCDNFPQDGVLDKFDTVGAALSTSPLHLEMYEQSASRLVQEIVSAPATDARRTRIYVCDPKAAAGDAACMRTILKAFGRRAWRRPVTDDDVAGYASLLDDAKKQGDGFDQGVTLALQGMLLSPNFIFHVELDPDAKTLTHPLGPYEVASRLSYALWASMPDEALFQAADAGKLATAADVQAAVRRMLDDPKARALVTDFGEQWLTTRDLAAHQVDAKVFPKFDATLRDALREESDRFVDAWVHADRPLTDLIGASYTFVNDRLASHYGLPAGGAWRRVDMTGTPRRGILGEGAVLTMTSHADRTSPTGRGAWVLDQIMCSRLPEPPPGIPPLPTAAMGQETLKQRLARHRTDPSCATCHALMDPIGLGLEGFDAIGASRTVENGVPIDASGELPGGVKFSGAVELGNLLVADARFASCVTRRLLTFMVGRTFDGADDEEWISRITKDGQSTGGSFKSLLLAIASSAAFRSRGAEGSAP
jgi:hypothetical protein